VALQRWFNALYGGQVHLSSKWTAPVAKAPARRDGQARARRRNAP